MSNSFDPTTPLGSYPEFPLEEVEFLLGVKDGKPVRIRNSAYVAPKPPAAKVEAPAEEAPKPESKPTTKKAAAKKAAAPKKDDD